MATKKATKKVASLAWVALITCLAGMEHKRVAQWSDGTSNELPPYPCAIGSYRALL
jgi:hypothetical protein